MSTYTVQKTKGIDHEAILIKKPLCNMGYGDEVNIIIEKLKTAKRVHNTALSWRGCTLLDTEDTSKFIEAMVEMSLIAKQIDELIKTIKEFDDLEVHLTDIIKGPCIRHNDRKVLMCPKDTSVIGDLKVVEVQ